MKILVFRIIHFAKHYSSIWHLKRLLIFIASDLILLTFVRKKQSDSVLILRFDLLGDYLIGRKFLRMARSHEAYRSKKIILCANIALRELIEIYDKDVFDDFCWIDRNKFLNEFWYRLKTLRKVKKLGILSCIHPMRDPYLGDCIVRATFAKERIGREAFQNRNVPFFEQISSKRALGDSFYTKLIHEDNSVTFEFDRNRNFFSTVLPGVPLPERMDLDPITVSIPKIEGPFAVLMPGASESFREWPPERFAQIARHLYLTRGLQIILLGSQADWPKAVLVQKNTPEIPIVNLCGTLTLSQVVYLVSQCVIGITNDSGGIHLLAALNKAGVAISNCFSFGWFHPYPPTVCSSVSFVYPPAFYSLSLSWAERKEIYGRAKTFSINEIPTETVIERVEAVLDGRPYHDSIQDMCNQMSRIT